MRLRSCCTKRIVSNVVSVCLLLGGFPATSWAGVPPPGAGEGKSAQRAQKRERKEQKRERKEQKRAERLPPRLRPNWRFEFNNDAFLNSDSDNLFSAGWSLQKHGRRVYTWEEARGTLAFGRVLAKPFLPTKAMDRSFRESWSVGQAISTPEDIGAEQLLANDIPYSAMLGTTNGWIAFNDTKFTGFQMLIGIVGPAALGEEVQTAVHTLINAEDPKGWGNQLDTEPVLNFTYMWKRKLVNTKVFDLAFNTDAALGNWFTLGEASFEFRIGKNKPKGFLYIPDPIGRSMFYDAALRPDAVKKQTLYFSTVFRYAAMLRMLILDGSTFEDSNDLEDVREDFVGQLIFGLHYRRINWGVHANWWFTTDLIESGAMVMGDTGADFGTITLEYRF